MFAATLKSLEEFRVARWAKTGNRSAQIILSLMLVAGLNLLAARHYERWDLTTTRRHSLSAETRGYLGEIPRAPADPPVELILTISPSDPNPAKAQQNEATQRELRGLLREYKYAAETLPGGPAPVRVDEVDPYRQLRRAEELNLPPDTAVSIRRGDRIRNLQVTDLYAVDAEGQPTAFYGERAITSAILDVIEDKKQKIYFTTGHGEPELRSVQSSGMSELAQVLRERNFETAQIDLTTGTDVPADADLLVIAGPLSQLQPIEAEKLRRYLNERRGRVALFLRPPIRTQMVFHGLENLLFEWGLMTDDALVFDMAATSADLNDALILKNFAAGGHPVTNFRYPLNVRFGFSRPVQEDIGAPPDARRRVTSLVLTNETAWGKRGYRIGDTESKIIPEVDLKGPISVAAISEFSPQGAVGLPQSGGKLVVFGDATFIANANLGLLGNTQLLLNTVNYLLDREGRLNIPPKPPFKFELGMDRQQVFGLVWRFGMLPALVALLGGVVYFVRHR